MVKDPRGACDTRNAVLYPSVGYAIHKQSYSCSAAPLLVVYASLLLVHPWRFQSRALPHQTRQAHARECQANKSLLEPPPPRPPSSKKGYIGRIEVGCFRQPNPKIDYKECSMTSTNSPMPYLARLGAGRRASDVQLFKRVFKSSVIIHSCSSPSAEEVHHLFGRSRASFMMRRALLVVVRIDKFPIRLLQHSRAFALPPLLH